MIGIYKIENLITHQIYIGQSIHISTRWNQEIRDSQNSNSSSYNYPLQVDMRKYGIKNFSFEIIETCPIEELNTKEKYWVNYFDSYHNGYNQTKGGGQGYLYPSDDILQIINDLKTTDLYHREIAEKHNVSAEVVQGINTGRYWFNEKEDYPLQKNHKEKSHHIINGIFVDEHKKYYCIDCGKEISQGATYCMECSQKRHRKVERPSKEELEEYLFSINGNFTEAGKHFDVSDNSVRKWCKNYNLPTHSSNYKTKIENPNKGRSIPKKVLQFDMDDNFIAEYNSIAEACRAIGKLGESSHISGVCSGKRKSASGYKWKYVE